MNIIGRKLQIWFGGIGIIALVAIGSLAVRPTERSIQSDPREFLLRASDLPQAGGYVIPPHERHAIHNDLIVYLLGDAAGEQRIRQTGRVVGWRVHFVQAAGGAAVPHDITQTVTQYASARGARFNLETYLLSIQNPENGWKVADLPRAWGDASVLERRSQTLPSGSRPDAYALSFTYRNIGVRLEITGEPQPAQVDELAKLADTILARLGAVQPRSGPVPSPTPGFEAPEEGRLIYR